LGPLVLFDLPLDKLLKCVFQTLLAQSASRKAAKKKKKKAGKAAQDHAGGEEAEA